MICMFKEIFCTECLDTVRAQKITKNEVFTIKDEHIEVESMYYQCPDCGELMYDTDNPSANIEKAYNEYRVRKNLLMPEEIISIREKYGLSQRQLARVLGWSHATLSKYETGALPSKSHNNTLALLKNPLNVLELLKRNEDDLSEIEKEKIKEKLLNYMEDNKGDLIFNLTENLFYSSPNEFTGYKKFDMDKLVQTVKFFASKDNRLNKVKLIKYLFYSDFLNFKRFTLSITGLRYKHLPMGPVPDDYDILLGFVTRTGEVNKELIPTGYANPAERFESIDDEIDYSLFTREEVQTLNDVYDKLNHHSSKSISELSHEETAWLETEHIEDISYKYASVLSLD